MTVEPPFLKARPKPKPRRRSHDLTSSDSDDSALLTLTDLAQKKSKLNTNEKHCLSDVHQEPPSKRARVYSPKSSPIACKLPSRDLDQTCIEVPEDKRPRETKVDDQISMDVPQTVVKDSSAYRGEQLFDMLEEQLDEFNNWLQDSVLQE